MTVIQTAIDKPDGVYRDMPFTEYLALPRLSTSGIKLLLQSPMDFWVRSWLAGDQRETEQTSDAMDLGTAYHKRIVEGREAFLAAYAPAFDATPHVDALDTMDDLRERARELGLKVGGTKAELIARILEASPDEAILSRLEAEYDGRHAGKTLLASRTMQRIEMAAAMIEKHPDLRKAFTGGMPEVTVLWTDPDTGVRMKARIDYLKPRAIVDLKTFSNPYGKPVENAVLTAFAGGRYQIQAAVYDEAVRLATEKPGDWYGAAEMTLAQREREIFFVFQATGPAPVALGYRFPKGTMFDIGRMQMRKGIDLFKQFSDTFGADPWIDVRPIAEFDDLSFPQYAMEGT